MPKATLDSDSGLYFVNCNATAPAFSVTLAGKRFPVDARDQILNAGTDNNGNVLCISGTQPGGADTPGNVFILSVPFFLLLVFVADISLVEMFSCTTSSGRSTSKPTS